MDLSDKKRLFIIASVAIVVFCIAHTILVFVATKPPEFLGLMSTRLLGANDRDIFIEMTWNVRNVSLFPYILDNATLHFHEQEIQIARVFLDDAVIVNAFANTRIKVNAAINRDIFERLIRNSIDDYSFDLRGSAEARFLFIFGKKLPIAQYIPIRITNLLSDFLQDSFKNAIFFEQIIITDTSTDCIIVFINRTGFEMEIMAFDGKIQIGKSHSGTADYFFPVYFREDESRKTTRIRFRTESTLIDRNFNQRYFVDGRMKVELWGREYAFPVYLLGEN